MPPIRNEEDEPVGVAGDHPPLSSVSAGSVRKALGKENHVKVPFATLFLARFLCVLATGFVCLWKRARHDVGGGLGD